MSEEDALLAAIHAAPDDDTPRLVYADWLDEHDRPERAEFIRVQVGGAHDQSPEEQHRLAARERELLDANYSTWVSSLGPCDGEKMWFEFSRGFPERLEARGAQPNDFRIFRSVPGLRRLEIEQSVLDTAALRDLAALQHLDSLTVSETPADRDWLSLLEPLPCWTYVRIYSAEFSDGDWEAFQERRIGKIALLPRDQQRRAAVRFLSAIGYDRVSPDRPVLRARLSQSRVTNAELRLLAALPELEEVYISESGVTAAGLAHLSALPDLKSVELFRVDVATIAPLAGCSKLEQFSIYPEYEIDIGDAGTEGLERLTNLRGLMLRNGGSTDGFRDATVRRLAPLRELRSLDLDLGELESEDCLAALSGLTRLETLSLSGRLSDDGLRHLAPLRRLQVLSAHVASGGEGLRHLAGLTDVYALYLNGAGVNDRGVRHLAPLKKLRTLMAQYSEITEAGARALADALPEVTIILHSHVIKSPRRTVTFHRSCAELTSALLPAHWRNDTRASSSLWLREDGWENVGGWSGGVVGPGEIQLYVLGEHGKSATDALNECVNSNSHLGPRVLEQDVVELTGGSAASCVYLNSSAQYLACTIAAGGVCAVLCCQAPPSRFEEFRPLFMFIAQSLRVGPAALEGVGEEITVPVAQL